MELETGGCKTCELLNAQVAAMTDEIKVWGDIHADQLKEIAALTKERDEALLIHQTDTGTESMVADLQGQVAALTVKHEADKQMFSTLHAHATALEAERDKLTMILAERTVERDKALSYGDRMSGKLSAAQAHIAQLRSAVNAVEIAKEIIHFPSYIREGLLNALAATDDTEALEARLREERERCAKACDAIGKNHGLCGNWHECAAVIREMSK
jgi:hypothetical protein